MKIPAEDASMKIEMSSAIYFLEYHLTLVLLKPDMPCLTNSGDPAQFSSKEANWSGSTLFVIKDVKLYQQPGSSNLIGKKKKKK